MRVDTAVIEPWPPKPPVRDRRLNLWLLVGVTAVVSLLVGVAIGALLVAPATGAGRASSATGTGSAVNEPLAATSRPSTSLPIPGAPNAGAPARAVSSSTPQGAPAPTRPTAGTQTASPT